MEVVFKKTHKYVCFECDGQFDWQDGKSVVFGKMEYKTVREQKAIEKFFCSERCYYKWKKLLNE